MAQVTTTVGVRERRTVAGVLVAAAVLVVAYWLTWSVHRSLVASETGRAYVQFEDAFPWPTPGSSSVSWQARTHW
jgi:hypothetical protein